MGAVIYKKDVFTFTKYAECKGKNANDYEK